MRKWSEIVLEGVSKAEKNFESLFKKNGLKSISANYRYNQYKGRTFGLTIFRDDDYVYQITVFKTKNNEGKTVYQLLSMNVGNAEKTLFKNYDLPSKSNMIIEYGFPETVESLKIIEKLFNDLKNTGDYEKFIKDWKRLGYIEAHNENPNVAFDKPKSEFAGIEGKEIKEGTILVDTWGYEQTNVYFYKVLSRKGDMITMRKLENKRLSFDAKRLSSEEVPSNKFEGDILKRKVVDGLRSEIVRTEYGYAEPWNGKPVEATHYA